MLRIVALSTASGSGSTTGTLHDNGTCVCGSSDTNAAEIHVGGLFDMDSPGSNHEFFVHAASMINDKSDGWHDNILQNLT